MVLSFFVPWCESVDVGCGSHFGRKARWEGICVGVGLVGALCGTELCAGKRAWLVLAGLHGTPPRFPSCLSLQFHPPRFPSCLSLQFHSPCFPSCLSLQFHPPRFPFCITRHSFLPVSASSFTPPRFPSCLSPQFHPPRFPSCLSLQFHPTVLSFLSHPPLFPFSHFRRFPSRLWRTPRTLSPCTSKCSWRVCVQPCCLSISYQNVLPSVPCRVFV